MKRDFLRKPRSVEEEEKRRLIAAALRAMVAEDTPGGKVLSFPNNSTRFERMIGLLQDTRDPNRAERSRTFLKYWGELAAEMRKARGARRDAMSAERAWDFPGLIRNDLEFARILIGLRWMVLRYRMGLTPDLFALSALVREGMIFAGAA